MKLWIFLNKQSNKYIRSMSQKYIFSDNSKDYYNIVSKWIIDYILMISVWDGIETFSSDP